jgi:histidinol dehydrogenase
LRTVIWSDLPATKRISVLARPPRGADPAVARTVARIIDEVESEGAAAVDRWALLLDGAAPCRLDLSPSRVDAARAAIDAESLDALEIAAANISRYHQATRPEEVAVEIDGVSCRRIWRAIGACGLYAPGGSAPLFSTLLMLALPAMAAGVPARIAVTPPAKDGGADPVMIAAAALSGLDGLWLVGGALAIAALAFGAGLPKAEKIFGPGNAFVAEAKRQVAARGLAAIDLPAGPSELMVIADDAADPAVIAADLLAQAEHDSDAQTILVTTSRDSAGEIAREVRRQLPALPRAAIAEAALARSLAIVVDGEAEAIAVANAYAPEHLALHLAHADAIADRIENAGAIFVGAASAEAFGDYICGPSHVLPTDASARVFGGVTTASFMKNISVQKMSSISARRLAGPTARLARLEGREAHALSAERRR